MTPQAEGSYFGPKHLEQMIPSYLHFTQNRPSQAKPTLAGMATVVYNCQVLLGGKPPAVFVILHNCCTQHKPLAVTLLACAFQDSLVSKVTPRYL